LDNFKFLPIKNPNKLLKLVK